MARLGYIQIIRNCNQQCVFCSNPDTGQMLGLSDVTDKIRYYRGQQYDGVILTGGEPTLHPDLERILAYCSDTGMASRLITNGQKTGSDPAYLDALVQAGLRHMHVSIHTHRAALQASLTGNKESLGNIVRTIHAAKRLGLQVDINQTICSHNADHLDETISWLIENFPYLHHVSWTFLDPYQNRVADHPDVIPTLSEAGPSLMRAMKMLDDSGRTFRVDIMPLCYLGEFAWCSTETRALVKREQRAIDFLDERGRYSADMWFYGHALTCSTCSLKEICVGLRDIEGAYQPEELQPQTINPQGIIDKILEN